jgi:hypothetical protein
MTVSHQLVFLLVLAIPIASIAWTVTHEEVFREPRDWCVARSKSCEHLLSRKAFYLFTCEYCFSHWVTAVFLFITRYKLLFDDWRGYLIAGFSLVWLANIYMSFFGRMRLEIREDRLDIAAAESTTRTDRTLGGAAVERWRK